MTTKFINAIRRFHRDEEGLETLQVVMILGFTAMVMITTATVGEQAATWMNGKWVALQGANITADASSTASLKINSALGFISPGVINSGS
ncbi:MAG TPA: hypothetical protein VH107_03785 [Lacipirellulaceae bacterium]|jgi:Flp pilus assembly pilin Flp|nr:hypothetical protein [Lacipirellulaceae bacterium]